MYRLRMYKSPGEIVVAACDDELVGQTLKKGKVRVPVSETFYGTDRATERELAEALAKCTVANLVGERVIKVAKRMGLIDDQRILDLDGVPHAQVAKV